MQYFFSPPTHTWEKQSLQTSFNCWFFFFGGWGGKGHRGKNRSQQSAASPLPKYKTPPCTFASYKGFIASPIPQHSLAGVESLPTDPGMRQAPRSSLQGEKKTAPEASPGLKREVPKAGTLCACGCWTAERKRRACTALQGVSVVRGLGGRGKERKKRNPRLQAQEGWLEEAAAERNALLLLLHGNYSRQKESGQSCC